MTRRWPGSPLTDAEIERRLDAAVGETAAKIERNDRHELIGVFPAAADPDPGVVFTYTVGLTRKGRRELIVYGLPHEVAGQMLNVLGDLPDEPLGKTRVWGELDVDVRPITDPACLAAAEVNMARAVYGPDVAVAQVAWPDPQGRYPGDPGCEYDGVLPRLA